jgi:8-oxo-dGTP pyrophosphatase MutT (NUDIX family)
MRWVVHGEQTIYDSDWLRLAMVDVEVPGGRRFDHHVVRTPQDASGTLVVGGGLDGGRDSRRVLLLWRHRFVTDRWGWEIPAGRLDEGETAQQAAERECLEETGWRPGPLRSLASFTPVSGLVDLRFHLFAAEGATHVGEPVDVSESERVEWVEVARLRDEMAGGQVVDGLSLTALLWGFTFGLL